MTRWRVGLLGGGRVARNHATAIGRHPRTELAGVCDLDPATREQWDAQGVATYARPEDLLAEALDVVYVLTPRGLHVEHATAALAAGRHVLVEKPVGQTVSEVRAIAEAAIKAGRVCVPGHNAVRLPELERIRRQLAEGALGQVLHLRIDELYALPPALRAELRSPVDEVLIHPLYTVVHLLGRPEALHALATDPLDEGHGHGQVAVTLRLAAGGIGRLFLSWVGVDHTDAPDTYRLALHGTDGAATYSRRGIVDRIDGDGNVITPLYQELFDRMTAYVVEACLEGSAPIDSDLQEAADAVALLEAVRRSVERDASETPDYHAIPISSPSP